MRRPIQRWIVGDYDGAIGLYETAQALFVYAKSSSLYKLFVARYPGHPISFSLFKSIRPWYVRRAKQETCLCKHCENFKAYGPGIS